MNWVKGVKYKVTEGDYTQGGKHTREYTDVVLKGVPEIYVMLLANVTLVNLIYKKKMSHNEKEFLPLDECMKFGG